MNLEEIRGQLEAEFTFRAEELYFFKNQIVNTRSEKEAERFRRALVLILYSHFEGFFKFALELYVDELNKANLSRGEVNSRIATAAMFEIFEALKDPNKKCQEFKKGLPEDSKLHTHARSIEFIESYDTLLKAPLKIPSSIVDAESNLKPVIIKKNLYRLGFDYKLYEDIHGQVDYLLKLRNNISHGTTKDGIDKKSYESLEGVVMHIIQSIQVHVFNALKDRSFLKEA